MHLPYNLLPIIPNPLWIFCRVVLRRSLALLAIIMLCLTPFSAQAAFKAEVPRQTFQEGEIIILTLSTDVQTQGSPNLSPLKANFDVLGQSQSSQITRINGRLSVLLTWRIELLPKTTGKITIPALALGSERTQAIPVTVQKTSPPPKNLGSQAGDSATHLPDLFLTLEADDDTPYVQQEVLVTLTIHHTRPLQQGQLSQLNLPNAVMTEIKEQSEDYKRIGGRNYNTLSVHHLVTPQKSGNLEVGPFRLVAELGRDPGSGRGFRSRFFNQSERRVVSSDALVLKVQPKPASYPKNAPWLPAKSVSLSDEWSQTGRRAQLGEAITRSVTLDIQGQTARILPEFEYPPQSNAKIYADQSMTEEEATRRGTQSQRSFSLAVVPTEPGELTLPKKTIYWWNVGRDRLESLSLPGRTWTVEGAVAQQPTRTGNPNPVSASTQQPNPRRDSVSHVQETASKGDNAIDNAKDIPEDIVRVSSVPRWMLMTMLFLLALWAITAGLAWYFYQQRARTNTQPSSKPPSDPKNLPNTKQWQSARKKVLHCIEHKNYPELIQALITLGQAHWQDQTINSLGHLIQRCGDLPLKAPLIELERYRYHPKSQAAPDLAQLAKRLKQLKKPETHSSNTRAGTSKSHDAYLAPLHPG
jgi:hypothetical protein